MKEQSAEELAIFLLGGTAFVLYLIKENQLKKDRIEKGKIQRDASRMSKDLTSSYSYIGEINRKLEIFKNISLGLPAWSKALKNRERECFEYILSAIRIITRAEEYSLRFVDIVTEEVLLEIRSNKTSKIEISSHECLKEGKKYFETDGYMVAISPENIKEVVSIITLKKRSHANSADDPDILKAIASQALFLYMYSKRERHHELKLTQD